MLKNNGKISLYNILSILPKDINFFLRIKYFKKQLLKSNLKSEEVEFFYLNHFLKKGDYCVDVGANIGRYTFKMSEIVGQKGHVFAFEPVIESFSILSYLRSLNKYRNISLFNIALGRRTEMIGVKKKECLPKNQPHPFLFDTLTNSKIVKKSKNKNTYLTDLDSFRFPKKISLIKIDVEGFEDNVLNGMKKTILKYKPLIIIDEKIKKISNKTKDFLKILENLNIEENKIIIIVGQENDNLYLSSRNIEKVNLVNVATLSTYDIMNSNFLLADKSSVEYLNNNYIK